jgi:hypothetical protein
LPRDTGLGADPVLKSFAAGEPQLWPGLYTASITTFERNHR